MQQAFTFTRRKLLNSNPNCLCSCPNSFPLPAPLFILLLLCQLSSLLLPCPPSYSHPEYYHGCQLLPFPTPASTLVNSYSTQCCHIGCSLSAKCFGVCSVIPRAIFSTVYAPCVPITHRYASRIRGGLFH